MIFGSLLLLTIIPLILLFTIGIPIIIGVCVYRDANTRVDCNPWLWALVAMLVPSYIGLVVYLIIRNDYPKKNIADNISGSRGYSTDGSSTDQNQNTYYQQNYDNGATTNPNTLPTWAKAVLIIVAVVIGICIISMVGAAIYHIFGFRGISSGMYL